MEMNMLERLKPLFHKFGGIHDLIHVFYGFVNAYDNVEIKQSHFIFI